MKKMVDAFMDYPLFRWMERKKRRAVIEVIYRAGLRKCNIIQEKHGLLMYLPYEKKITIWDYIKSGGLKCLFILNRRERKKLMDCFQIMRDQRKICLGPGMVYGYCLYVEKEHQGQGIGKRLIQKFFAVCDKIYIETHDKNNVEIYKKLGFKLVDFEKHSGIYFFYLTKESE